MTNVLEYKDYVAKIEYSNEDKVLYGVVEGTVDLISFESETAQGIEQAFHDTIDDYLIFCQEINKEPNKSYKGSFNVRVSPELHKKVALYATKNSMSLNSVIKLAIEAYIDQPSVSTDYLLTDYIDVIMQPTVKDYRKPLQYPSFAAISSYSLEQ